LKGNVCQDGASKDVCLFREAGLRSAGQLNIIDGVTLKASGMTWSMMRWMRKFFNDAGWKRALPSEERIKNKLECYDIPYETGHFNTPFVDYDKLNYIHIQIPRLWNTITTWAKQRYQAGQLVWWPNQPANELWFSLGVDKGGHSTKLMETWLNHHHTQSEDASMMLGLYEGKEGHHGMSLGFGGVLEELGYPHSNWKLELSTDNQWTRSHQEWLVNIVPVVM